MKECKTCSKTSISLFLTKLATVFSEDEPDKAEMKVILTPVKEQRNKVLAFIDNLEDNCDEAHDSEREKSTAGK